MDNLSRDGVVLLAMMAFGASAPAGEESVRVRPETTDEIIANPGMGWQTFHRFADEDRHLDGLPSGSAYFRFYWDELEPEEGQIDFEKLDTLLARARKAEQRLAFRVMCAGTSRKEMYVPMWLREKGCGGFEYRYQSSGPKRWVPDMDDPVFQKAHYRLIDALGKRYDGHPDLDLVDIGTVGLWGEWHMSGTGVELPSLATRKAIIDAWCEAFPLTPKVMLIGDLEGMKHAISKGCGWRADCLGDMGGFSKTWNHMEHFYGQQIGRVGAEDAWKKGPVAFESCWDMRKWKDEGWDIRHIFDYGISYHVSYMNNKSAPIPEGTRVEVERFLRKIGYRLVLEELQHGSSARAGDSLATRMAWRNDGVAPPYRADRLAFRLRAKANARANGRNDDGASGKVLLGSRSIRGWLPGRTDVRDSVKLPADLSPGTYALDIGVVDPKSREPTVRLAIEGRREDGWYAVSDVEIEGN